MNGVLGPVLLVISALVVVGMFTVCVYNGEWVTVAAMTASSIVGCVLGRWFCNVINEGQEVE